MAIKKKKGKRKNEGRRTSKKKSSSSSKFSYERTPDSVRKRAQQSSSNREGFIRDTYKTFRPADGQNHIRILPPSWDDAEHFAFDTFVNYGVGSDESSFLSLSAMLGEDDPIAEERQRAEKAGDVEYADTLKPTKRPVCFVVDKSAKRREQVPLLWAMPWTVDRDIAVLMTDKRSGAILPIDDLEEGYDIFFEKTGKGMKTRYQGLEIDRESSPAVDDEDQLEEIEEFLVKNPIPDCLVFHEYDHIAKVFSGGGKKGPSKRKGEEPTWEEIHAMEFDELEALVEEQNLDIDIEEFDEEEDLADQICDEMGIKKSKKGKKGKAKKTSSKLRKMRDEEEDEQEEEDDDEEDDEDEEDEEDDEEDDDDDEEDDDEEEEEEELPRRRKKSSKKKKSRRSLKRR